MFAQVLGDFLDSLAFQVQTTQVPAAGGWEPLAGDVVSICGPKSSATIADVLANDPFLDRDLRYVLRQTSASEQM